MSISLEELLTVKPAMPGATKNTSVEPLVLNTAPTAEDEYVLGDHELEHLLEEAFAEMDKEGETTKPTMRPLRTHDEVDVPDTHQDIGNGTLDLSDGRPVCYVTTQIFKPLRKKRLKKRSRPALPAPAQRVTKRTKKEGGGRWKYCMQRKRETGIPYPTEKRILIAYLIQRGICYQADMVDFIKTRIPKIYTTFFDNDEHALQRYVERARRLPAKQSRGPRVNWFLCDNVHGKHTVWQLNTNYSDTIKKGMQEAYAFYLKDYVKRYDLPMDAQSYVLRLDKPPTPLVPTLPPKTQKS